MTLEKSKMENKEILFGAFEFHEGLNVTVRRGLKWHNMLGMYIAKSSSIGDKGAKRIKILETAIYRFKDLPAKVLSYEHQSECQTYAGLFDAMVNAYGKDFSENEYVVVIYFIA